MKFILRFVPILAVAALDLSATVNPPARLPASDWTQIRAAYQRHRHSAVFADGAWRACNPGQRWLTRYDGRGFAVTPETGSWTWGLELDAYGFAGRERRLGGRAKVRAEHERVTYDWGRGLEEWFVNDERGLEHGFTLRQRPGGAVGPLWLRLRVRGELKARVAEDGRGVSFAGGPGADVRYRGLKVWDATGRILAARFERAGAGVDLRIEEDGARYPITIDPIAQQAYVKASNTNSGDQFGWSVAASGDTVVVGARFEQSNATGINGNQGDNSAVDSGAAYVFVRSGNTWTQQAYLKASNTDSGDQFGFSVAIAGDTVVVGAPTEDSNGTSQGDNSASAAGAVYVFVRVAGVWSQQAYLKASNREAGDQIGYSVAISGDTVVAGAPNEDSAATGVNGDQTGNSLVDSGASYVFVRSAGSWSQQSYLKASNTGESDKFGSSVAISGNTVVVGAADEDSSSVGVNGNQTNNNATDSGAAYVFSRQGTTWAQEAYLKASNTEVNDDFGTSVAVSGDTILVGAVGEDSNATGINGNQADNSAAGSGAAYIFVRTIGAWSQQAYVKASNTGFLDLFGRSVALSGDVAIIGAVFEASNATGIDGDQANNTVSGAGAAYLFARTGSSWSQRAYMKASNTGSGDNFGHSVAVSGNLAAVGAMAERSSATGIGGIQSDNSAIQAGAAYIFNLDPILTQAGIFRFGFFWLQDVNGDRAFNTPPDRAFAFGGVAGDIPISGDWNGDGRDKVGIYRSSNGLFILDYDGDLQLTAADKVYNLGVGTQPNDVPVAGDWNGSGTTKVGLFRQGFFWILDTNGNGTFDQSSDQAIAFGGLAGDVPVVGDWDGNGTSNLGLFRFGFFWILDVNGNGQLDNVNQPQGDRAFAFGGVAGDVPLVGRWADGDAKSKVGLFRAGFLWILDANGNTAFDGTGAGQDIVFAFGGLTNDKPVVGRW